MRSVLITLGMAVVAGITGRWAYGEDVLVAASVRVDVQMVSVSVAEAGNLVPAFQDRKRAEAAWTQVQAMIGRGEAKLLGWPVLWLQNGEHGTAASIMGGSISTEFAPPEFPQTFGQWPRISATWGVSMSTPTAFEVRDVGAILDADATVEEGGQVVALTIVPQYVRLLSFREWYTQKSPLGIAGVQQQPFFQTAKTTTQLRIHRDQPALVGVFVFSEPEPHVELHILHARVTLLPPSAAIPPPK